MEKLFSTFTPATAADWKKQIEKDLKGETAESLTWHSDNGIAIRPFYTAEDRTDEDRPLFTRTGWQIAVKSNGDAKSLKQALMNSAEAVVSDVQFNDPAIAYQGVDLELIGSFIWCNVNDVKSHRTWIESQLGNNADIRLFMQAGEAIGDWYDALPQKLQTQVNIDVLPYHNRNCYDYYELALAMSWLNEHLENHPSAPSVSEVCIRMGVNSDYFNQIAKLRALRTLVQMVAEHHGISVRLQIIAETTLTNKTLSDQYNNLLRTSTETLAAVTGGADVIVVNEYNFLAGKPDAEATRLAINQQLVIREETYLSHMSDVASGSYYIETLTDELGHRALETFKRIEEAGGITEAEKSGLIDSDITSQASTREELLRSGQQQVIGVTRYNNAKEQLNISAEDLARLAAMRVNNPALQYEIDNLLKPKHA